MRTTTHPLRQARRDRAAERARIRALLGPEQQLRELDHRPGWAIRERKRLLAQIASHA